MNKEQGRPPCIHLPQRQRGDGDDVMNACKLRVGYDGRSFLLLND